jgi:lysophospholipase L1-like esterase
MKKIILVLVLSWPAFINFSTAQKVVVAMGSSSVMGSSATTNDSAWVGRLQHYFRKNTGDGEDTIVYKVGNYGYTTYHELPDNYPVTLAGRPQPAPGFNITTALSLNPDVVIVNLPSNDVASLSWLTNPNYTVQETMNNYRVMFQATLAAGARCYFTTTQPRNDLTAAQRQLQLDIRDSTIAYFGNYAINIWDDLVTSDGTLSLRDEVRNLGYPDADYHLNNLGHRLIFERIVNRNIFSENSPLPLHLANFTARKQNNQIVLHWKTENEEPNTRFEIERSNNGRDFSMMFQINGNAANGGQDYAWTDISPAAGKNFYRLKIQESSRRRYSPIISVVNGTNQLVIERVFQQGNRLTATISCDRTMQARASVISLSGAIVQAKEVTIQRPSAQLSFDLGNLSPGEYFLTMTTTDGTREVLRFAWLK